MPLLSKVDYGNIRTCIVVWRDGQQLFLLLSLHGGRVTALGHLTCFSAVETCTYTHSHTDKHQ